MTPDVISDRCDQTDLFELPNLFEPYASLSRMSDTIPSPPGGTGIRVVESSDDLLVIAIPPGGRGARGIGIFALAWNTIVIPLSVVMLLVPDEGWDNGPPPPFVLPLFFGVFWAVGFGFAFAWLKMRFTTTLLAVKPDELTVQRTFPGSRKLKQTQLDESSSARLDVAYQSNDSNVYRVCIAGTDREEAFGTRLSKPEKDWLVNAVNRFLGQGDSVPASRNAAFPDYCTDCGTELLSGQDKRVCADCGRVYYADDGSETSREVNARPAARTGVTESVIAISPHELSPGSAVVVEIDELDRLQFWYPFEQKLLRIFGFFFGLFSLVWFAGVIGVLVVTIVNVMNGQLVAGQAVLFIGGCILFGGIGLIPFSVARGAFRPRIVLDLNQSRLEGKVRAGMFRFGRSISTASIRDVGLGPAQWSQLSQSRTGLSQSGQLIGMVYSSEFDMPVSIGNDRQLDQDVTGLILYQLERMGHHFSDE